MWPTYSNVGQYELEDENWKLAGVIHDKGPERIIEIFKVPFLIFWYLSLRGYSVGVRTKHIGLVNLIKKALK